MLVGQCVLSIGRMLHFCGHIHVLYSFAVNDFYVNLPLIHIERIVINSYSKYNISKRLHT